MRHPSEASAVEAFNVNRCTYWYPERDGEPESRCTRQADSADSVGDRCSLHARPAINPDLPPLALLADRLAFKMHGRRESDYGPIDYLYPDDARTIVDGVRDLNARLARMVAADAGRAPGAGEVGRA